MNKEGRVLAQDAEGELGKDRAILCDRHHVLTMSAWSWSNGSEKPQEAMVFLGDQLRMGKTMRF